MMTQAQALDVLKSGSNVFLTGEPGSGKTHTLNRYVRWLRERRIERAITASTGIAATHVGGFTIQSWSGIGVRTSLDARDLERIGANPFVERRIRGSRVLVIDEISMLSASTLDAVDAVCRAVRKDPRAFGGMQVVFVGDFFQLPPVPERAVDQASLPLSTSPAAPASRFAFASTAWREANPAVCYLDEQHRQADGEFVGLLRALRSRDVTQSHRDLLAARTGVAQPADAALLFSHNADVDRLNAAELAKLDAEPSTFAMESRGPPAVVAALVRGCPSPESLVLKRGARVVFTRNDAERRWANGTLGVVTGFDDEGLPLVRARGGELYAVEPVAWSLEDHEKVLGSIRQVPLRLAWALTIHKSQGMSLDAAHVDLTRAFEFGQGYVALSRVRSLAGLSLVGLNHRALEVDPGVAQEDRLFRERSGDIRARVEATPAAELRASHDAFVLASGGRVEGSGDVRPVKAGGAAKTKTKTRGAKAGRDGVAPTRGEQRWESTVALVRAGRSIDAVAKERSRTPGTIIQHLENALDLGRLSRADIAHLEGGLAGAIVEVHAAMRSLGTTELKPVFTHLGGRIGHDDLRVARLFFRLR